MTYVVETPLKITFNTPVFPKGIPLERHPYNGGECMSCQTQMLWHFPSLPEIFNFAV